MPVPPFLQQGASRTRAVTRSRAVRLVVILGIVTIMVLGLCIYLFGDFGTGYKFTISGSVTYTPGFLGTPGDWTISNLRHSIPQRDYSVLSTLWSWPWESGDVKVTIEVPNQNTIFPNEQWLGKYIFTGGTDSFNIEFRHVSVGSHNCHVKVIETNCGIIPFNCAEDVVVSDNIQINIIGEGI